MPHANGLYAEGRLHIGTPWHALGMDRNRQVRCGEQHLLGYDALPDMCCYSRLLAPQRPGAYITTYLEVLLPFLYSFQLSTVGDGRTTMCKRPLW
jgi:hypothetical protein